MGLVNRTIVVDETQWTTFVKQLGNRQVSKHLRDYVDEYVTKPGTTPEGGAKSEADLKHELELTKNIAVEAQADVMRKKAEIEAAEKREQAERDARKAQELERIRNAKRCPICKAVIEEGEKQVQYGKAFIHHHCWATADKDALVRADRELQEESAPKNEPHEE